MRSDPQMPAPAAPFLSWYQDDDILMSEDSVIVETRWFNHSLAGSYARPGRCGCWQLRGHLDGAGYK